MHELGVTFYVVKDVKKVAQENKVDKIDYVKLEIGEVSGVVFPEPGEDITLIIVTFLSFSLLRRASAS